jgi:hypothetical protein
VSFWRFGRRREASGVVSSVSDAGVAGAPRGRRGDGHVAARLLPHRRRVGRAGVEPRGTPCKTTGIQLRVPFVHVWRMSGDKVTRGQAFTDTAVVADALGR